MKDLLPYNKYIIYLPLFMISIFTSCLSDEDRQLHYALKAAGENRIELERVLEHYQGDTLRLRAAKYLISNMPYHYTLDTYLRSPNGEHLIVDVNQFEDRGKVYWYLDSLYKIGYQRVTEKHEDIREIGSEFLIQNIDLAFQMWQKPWAKDVPFDIFCRWVLPYRLQNEYVPIDLREKMMKRYLPLLDSAKVTTPLEAAHVINERFAKEFHFKDMLSPHYPTLETTLRNGYDACIGLCNLSVFIMRALGIPTTCDQATWTHMNLGHLWNVVYSEGKAYPYDNENVYFTDYPTFLKNEEVRRPAKVYRYQFDKLSTKCEYDDGFNFSVKSGLVEDVTNQYLTEFRDLSIDVDKENPTKSELVYLCTYNCCRWIPIATGERQKEKYQFKNVAGNNIFIVADSPDGKKLRFVTAPFYADTTGYIKKLIPQKENFISHTFSIDSMKLYHYMYLNYWDVDSCRFVKINCDKLTDSTRVYNRIPVNSLMVFLVPKELPFSDRNRPLFYIENDSIYSTRSDLSRN